jgi:hypothetical protein
MLPDFTRVVGTPRVAGLAYPFGRPFGQVNDAEGQRAVLRSALQTAEGIERPGGAVQLPFIWPEPPAQARGKLKEPPPIGKLLASRPWLFLKFLNGKVAD